MSSASADCGHWSWKGGLPGRSAMNRHCGFVQSSLMWMPPYHLMIWTSLECFPAFSAPGRTRGKDFRLAGFGVIEECSQVWQQLSPVRCDISGFGRRTSQTILDWLGNSVKPVYETRAPVQLVIRDSSGGLN